MAKPEIGIKNEGGMKLLKFEIPGGVTTPAEFAEATTEVADQLTGKEPVLINGRGPTWGAAMLAHAAHATPMVATYDPRLGYVVVATHDARWAIGDIIPDPEAS